MKQLQLNAAQREFLASLPREMVAPMLVKLYREQARARAENGVVKSFYRGKEHNKLNYLMPADVSVQRCKAGRPRHEGKKARALPMQYFRQGGGPI